MFYLIYKITNKIDGKIYKGVYFRIDEYDGNESVVIKDDEDWLIA